MHSDDVSRRQLVQIGVVSAGAAFAGCLGSGEGGSRSAQTTDEAAGTAAAYRRWLFAPSKVAFGPPILYTSLHLGKVLDSADALPNIDTSRFKSGRSAVPVSEVDYIHNFGSLIATTGTFEAGPVKKNLRERYSKSDEYRGYTIFSKEDVGAIGVKDGELLKSLWYTGADIQQNLKMFVDAGQGDVPRLQEVDETGRVITDAIDDPTGIRINTGKIDRAVNGAVAAGTWVGLGSDKSELGVVVVFPDEAATAPERVRTRLAETVFFDDVDAVPARVEGRAVIVKDRIPTADLESLQIKVNPANYGG
jgi:hypothetical protein